MNHEQAQTNLKLLLDWIDALRRDDIDSIARASTPMSPGTTSPAA